MLLGHLGGFFVGLNMVFIRHELFASVIAAPICQEANGLAPRQAVVVGSQDLGELVVRVLFHTYTETLRMTVKPQRVVLALTLSRFVGKHLKFVFVSGLGSHEISARVRTGFAAAATAGLVAFAGSLIGGRFVILSRRRLKKTFQFEQAQFALLDLQVRGILVELLLQTLNLLFAVQFLLFKLVLQKLNLL